LNRRCVGPLRAEDGSGGHYFELIAPQGLTVVRFWIGCRTKRKFNLLDVPIGSGRYGLNRRPEIIDHIVVGNNVRNVPRLIEGSERSARVARSSGRSSVRASVNS